MRRRGRIESARDYISGRGIAASCRRWRRELLADVKAEDNLSGDVSGTLVVEQISEITEENERTITYAAIDEKGNVGRAERTLKYIDYQGPWFKLKDSLRYKAGDTLNVLDRVEAESLLGRRSERTD